MGTTTFFLRYNDFGAKLGSLSPKDLEKIDSLSPYRENKDYRGWRTPVELHNGNVEILVWWKGRLMRLRDAPKALSNKFYDKYKGKTVQAYEWTLLKKLALNEIKRLDKEFKKMVRTKKKTE